MKYEVQEKDKGLSIQEVLKRRLGFSTRLLRKLKREGGVTVNKESKWLNEKVKKYDVIEVTFPKEENHFTSQSISFSVSYEDEDLLILDKPPGIVVHPTKGHPDGTIANGLMKYMQDHGETFKIRFVNRLDMDTSGLLIVAKNAYAQEELVKQMSKGILKKRYLAIVEGQVAEEKGTIDLPIGIEDEEKIGRAVMADGAPSVTHFQVVKRLKGNHTLLSLLLETGRTHQIRVHLSHMGYPIEGDLLYGGKQERINRQALHAVSLTFLHPRSREEITVTADIPLDMKELME